MMRAKEQQRFVEDIAAHLDDHADLLKIAEAHYQGSCDDTPHRYHPRHLNQCEVHVRYAFLARATHDLVKYREIKKILEA